MAVAVDGERCPHNHVCPLIKICPVEAITQREEGYPVVDQALCVECGACVKACPMQAMNFNEL